MKKIIVEVSGGLVQNVYSDGPAEVYVVDWDNIEQTAPEEMPKNAKDFFFGTEVGALKKQFKRIMKDIKKMRTA